MKHMTGRRDGQFLMKRSLHSILKSLNVGRRKYKRRESAVAFASKRDGKRKRLVNSYVKDLERIRMNKSRKKRSHKRGGGMQSTRIVS